METTHHSFQPDDLDQLLFTAFPGLVMRKDLTQTLRGASKAPSYVLEFMLGKYCADLFDAQACLDMIRYTGVDGVTAARGAIGNPWIFQQARALAAGLPMPEPPTLFEQREVIAEHYRLAEELYGAERCLPNMRKFGIKYSRLHPQGDLVREDFCRVKQPGGWQAVLEKWYGVDGPGIHSVVEEPNPICVTSV